MIKISFREDEFLADIINFYESQGYLGGALETDKIALAFDDDRIIGVARISLEKNTYSLRGMFIDEAYQRKGIGREMLKVLEKYLIDLNVECYCIPNNNLDQFYGLLGFKVIPVEEGPSHIVERIEKYRNKGYKVFLMKRSVNK